MQKLDGIISRNYTNLQYGDEKMTNEEWFCNLSTQEKAMLIAAQGKYNTSENMQRMLCGTANGIENWLLSEHIETEW